MYANATNKKTPKILLWCSKVVSSYAFHSTVRQLAEEDTIECVNLPLTGPETSWLEL